ncbi:MAG: glycosyltransferase family 4 protein [Patescibacteria group bacterium]|nr:glycosyltransferase family 4 protein [Patescibacteria group bacterium]
MRLYYIANARMPNEKAHGIQIAKMCEAFIEAGVDLTLVVPNRRTVSQSLRDYYGLRVGVPLVRLPALDWYALGRVGYFLSSLSFMLSYTLFVWRKKLAGEDFILYTVDTENYSSSALALVDRPLFSEMHGSKPRTFAQRLLFKHARGIVAINSIIAEELGKNFPRSRVRYLVEPNGVDLLQFSGIDKKDARARLGLPSDASIVLYAGRFFAWKGLELLPPAAAAAPSIRWQVVGGGREDFARLVEAPLPGNLFFAGSRPHSEIPLWLAAADAFVVLGTARDRQSYRYTSPMKLFEYLAAGRPVVASDTPALREIVSEKEALFYAPDDARDLARAAARAAAGGDDVMARVAAGKRRASDCSWRARARRILRFMEETSNAHGHA